MNPKHYQRMFNLWPGLVKMSSSRHLFPTGRTSSNLMLESAWVMDKCFPYVSMLQMRATLNIFTFAHKGLETPMVLWSMHDICCALGCHGLAAESFCSWGQRKRTLEGEMLRLLDLVDHRQFFVQKSWVSLHQPCRKTSTCPQARPLTLHSNWEIQVPQFT